MSCKLRLAKAAKFWSMLSLYIERLLENARSYTAVTVPYWELPFLLTNLVTRIQLGCLIHLPTKPAVILSFEY